MTAQAIRAAWAFRPPRSMALLCRAWMRLGAGRGREVRFVLNLNRIPVFHLDAWEDSQADDRTSLHPLSLAGGLKSLGCLLDSTCGGAPEFRRAAWVRMVISNAAGGPSLLWIARRNGLDVGFCAARLQGRTAILAGLGVLPEHRRRGVGAMLLRRVIAEARRRGAERLELRVSEANDTAIRVCWRLGFQRA